MPSLLHFSHAAELQSVSMDVHDAWPQPLVRRFLFPCIPSCLLGSFRLISPYVGHHIPLGSVLRFRLCAGKHSPPTRSPIVSIKNASAYKLLCEVVWTIEADLKEGQVLYVTGDPAALGCWEPEMGILMTPTEHANIWKAKAKMACGTNFKYNYFIKGEASPSNDIIWRPGPQLSLSIPLHAKQNQIIMVRDSWTRSKTESFLPDAWGSWIEETSTSVKPVISISARDEDEIVKQLECDFKETRPCLNGSILKDEVYSCDDVITAATSQNSYSDTLLSERDQPVEEPWLFQSPLSFLTSDDNTKDDVSEKNDTEKLEMVQLEKDNQEYQTTEHLLPEEGKAFISKDDSIPTVILINSSICTLQRIAVLEDDKLVELLLEPVKSHVQCDSVYLGVVTKLVPNMGGAFVNIGNSRHSLMDIKQNRAPFVFPPFNHKTKKEVISSVSGATEEHSTTHEFEHTVHRSVAIEDAAEDGSQDFDDENDVNEDFDVLEVLNRNVNGSTVDYGEAEADLEGLLEGEHHLEDENINDSPSCEIKGSLGSLISGSQDMDDSTNENKWGHVRRGSKIIVQVVKEGLGTKSPTLTPYPKLRSRFWILHTRCDRIGVSKKITGFERTRLKVIAKTLQPQGFGLTVRTVAAGYSLEELQKDLEGLLSTWKNIMEHAKSAALAADEGVEGAIPVILHRAMGQTLSVVQDYFNGKVKKMVVDSPWTYHEVTNYLQEIAPSLCDRVELHNKRIPLFDEFNIEEEINNILSKRVSLPNGGSLVIEQTEALVSIDVNGGHGMFGHGTSQEKAILDVNLAAAKQIARELRLRDIGGIIVVDFIDMMDDANRRLVYEEVKKAVEKDRSMVKVSELSRHGLMEITRKRVRPSVTFMISEPCSCCHGTGRVEALETSLSKIEQEICRLLAMMNHKADPENPKSWPRFVLRVDNHMCNYLTSGKKTRLAILSSSLKVWILLKVARGFTRGQFEVEPFTDEKADKNQHQAAISILRTAEARTSNTSKKVTLIPVKKGKASRK